jgi:hypothetical protein
MIAEKPVAGERTSREEYIKARTALIITISVVSAALLPVLGALLGISVRIFRLISGI